MSDSISRRDLLALFAAFGAGAASDTLAQGYPSGSSRFRVAFENDKARVVEFISKLGLGLCGQGRHYHPAHLSINLTPVKARVTLEDGKVIEVENKAGEVFYAPAEWHTVENLTKGPVRGYMIELKDKEWKPSTGSEGA